MSAQTVHSETGQTGHTAWNQPNKAGTCRPRTKLRGFLQFLMNETLPSLTTGSAFLSFAAYTGMVIGVTGAVWMILCCLRGRQIRGQCVGPVLHTNPRWLLGSIAGGGLLVGGLIAAMGHQWFNCIMAVTMSVYGLLPLTGSLQFFENGLWCYWRLVPWKQFKHCDWRGSSNLVIRLERTNRYMELNVLENDRAVIETLLNQNVNVATNQRDRSPQRPGSV